MKVNWHLYFKLKRMRLSGFKKCIEYKSGTRQQICDFEPVDQLYKETSDKIYALYVISSEHRVMYNDYFLMNILLLFSWKLSNGYNLQKAKVETMVNLYVSAWLFVCFYYKFLFDVTSDLWPWLDEWSPLFNFNSFGTLPLGCLLRAFFARVATEVLHVHKCNSHIHSCITKPSLSNTRTCSCNIVTLHLLYGLFWIQWCVTLIQCKWTAGMHTYITRYYQTVSAFSWSHYEIINILQLLRSITN